MTDRTQEQIDGEEPLDPNVERIRAKLMRFVVINLAILFIALMAVVGALVYRAVSSGPSPETAAPSALPTPPAGSMINGAIPLPAGADIVSLSVADGRVSMVVEEGSQRSLLIYDIAEARMIARFRLVEE